MTLKMLEAQGGFICGLSLIALTAATPANAAEWQLSLGAQFDLYFGYVSYDGAPSQDFDGIDAVRKGQVFIMPSVTVDNGLRFGANITLERHYRERNAGAGFDEALLL